MSSTSRRIVGTLALSGVLATGVAAGASAAPAHHRPGSHTVARPADQDRTAPARRAARPTSTSTAAARTATSSTTTTKAVTTSTSTASTSTAAPSTITFSSGTSISTAGLSANAIKVLKAVNGTFPQITDIGGIRTGSDAQDHATGHALDLMIPNPTSASGKALGDEIAAFMQAHASQLGIKYVIWRQHIWSVARSSEGWRAMADRGSLTANHYDHVHVSVN